jgi:hypothetical protein
VKKRREEMKTISFESLYPFKPVKLLYKPDKSSIISWFKPKQPCQWIEKIVQQDKKDGKLAPNMYFKSNKNECIDRRKYSTSLMFTSKQY